MQWAASRLEALTCNGPWKNLGCHQQWEHFASSQKVMLQIPKPSYFWLQALSYMKASHLCAAHWASTQGLSTPRAEGMRNQLKAEPLFSPGP